MSEEHSERGGWKEYRLKDRIVGSSFDIESDIIVLKHHKNAVMGINELIESAAGKGWDKKNSYSDLREPLELEILVRVRKAP